MAEEQKQEAKGSVKAHRARLVGLAALALFAGLLLFAGWSVSRIFFKQTPPTPSAVADVGVVQMARVLAAHPDYAHLTELRATRDRLRADLNRALSPLSVKPSKTDAKPFDDAVWQKNAQTVIGARSELERERARIEQAYRKEHEAEYESRRQAIDAEYLNAILNINLKLDNQDAMHHPWDKKEDLAAEREKWQEELTALQHERGARQMELYRAWQQEVADHVARVLGPKLDAWKANAKTALDQQKAESARQQSEVQARNVAALQEQMDASRAIQQGLEKREQLQGVEDEIQSLETHILSDIAGRAAKVAILHHFTLILASPAETLDYALPAVRTGAPPVRFAPVVGSGTEDVTDALLEEMKGLVASDSSATSS